MFKRISITAVTVFCALLSLVSCEEKLNVTVFKPELVIQNGIGDVVNGNSFTFKIYSATGRFVIDAIEIKDDAGNVAYNPDRSSNDFPVQGITLGAEVQCGADNWASFSASSVRVPNKTVYTLTVTVSEPTTKNSVTLRQTFRGRTSLDVGEIMVTGFCKESDKGKVITSGTELNVQVKFSKRNFRLDGFHLPKGCTSDGLVQGKEYSLPEDCVWRLSVRGGEVTQDSADSLCFDIFDKETEKTLHLRYDSDILLRYPFNYTIECADVSSDKGTLTLALKTNRISFTPLLLEVTPEREDKLICGGQAFSTASDRSFAFFGATFRDDPNKTLETNALQTFGQTELESQVLNFDAKDVRSAVNQKIKLRFILKDSQTNVIVEQTYSFNVQSSVIPADVELFYIDGNGDEKVVGKASDSESCIYVGYYDDSPMGKARGLADIRFRFLSADGYAITDAWTYGVAVDSPATAGLEISEDAYNWGTSLKGRSTLQGKGDGVLYLRGGESAGEKTVRFTLTNPRTQEPIVFAVKVCVRQRCAVVIDGVVGEDLFYKSGKKVGWMGLVRNFTARLYEYPPFDGHAEPLYDYVLSNGANVTCEDIYSKVRFNETEKESSVSFYSGMKWKSGYSSPFFYSDYQSSGSGSMPYVYKNYKFLGDTPYYSIKSAPEKNLWPKTEGSGKDVICMTSSETQEKLLSELTQLVNYYCNNCIIYVEGSGGFGELWHYTYIYYNRQDYSKEDLEILNMCPLYSDKMSFYTRDVVWTDRSLDIRYVVYRFKNNKNYWWSSFDEGVWYQTVEDIPIRG